MLYADFEEEVRLLRTQFHQQVSRPHVGFWSGHEGAVHAYAVIRLLDAWNRFSRQLVLVSARGNVITDNGVKIRRSSVLAPGQLALDGLRAALPPNVRQRPVWEPRWFVPRRAIAAAATLAIENLTSVSAGLGLSATIPGLSVGNPEDLRICRNYFAHRSKTTFDELWGLKQQLGVPVWTAVDALPKVVVSGGATLFNVWCLDLLIRARAAIQ
jgi:hypothetical protein